MKPVFMKTKKHKIRYTAIQKKQSNEAPLPIESLSVEARLDCATDSTIEETVVQLSESGIFADFERTLSKNDFNVCSYAVYIDGIFKYGTELESVIVVDNCYSYTSPVVITSTDGLICNDNIKSRFIKQITLRNRTYMVCYSSYVYECFKDIVLFNRLFDTVISQLKVVIDNEYSAFMQ